MANLKKFVWEGANSGMKFELWNYSPRFKVPGSADLLELSPLRLKAKGEVNFIINIKGDIEIIMDNENDTGVCSVILNSERRDNVPYQVMGNTLVIRDTRTTIEMSTERKYTWIGVDRPVRAKIGLWPQGQTMEMD